MVRPWSDSTEFASEEVSTNEEKKIMDRNKMDGKRSQDGQKQMDEKKSIWSDQCCVCASIIFFHLQKL
jgi:hypothetical protein